MRNNNLNEEMQGWANEIEGYAREFGLDHFPVIFQMMSYDEINATAAYGGFPNRYPHWRFGMDYEKLRKGYTYGLSTIFEMVINTNPCYAFLRDCNNPIQQKIVMAHVYAHSDFFKTNYNFMHTNRKMIDEMANHAARIRRYIDRVGINKVENFIDACLSLENLIDFESIFRAKPEQKEEDEDVKIEAGKLHVKREYMQHYINPKEELEKEKKRFEDKAKEKKRFPEEPQKDVLLFLSQNAPLNRWQKSILDMIREEMYYFAPQGRTKILNEGWASFCESRIMTLKALKASEIIDFADHYSQVVSQYPGLALNPYALGLKLLRDIEDRWNKGRHGEAYENCYNMQERSEWDTGEMKGLKKVFEVRRNYSDVSFIDEFLTPEFCEKYKLFNFSRHKVGNSGVWKIDTREFEKVKKKLLFSLTNFGQPYIFVTDGNYTNTGELLLHHRRTEFPIDFGYAVGTLQTLERIWKRPVNLETFLEDRWYTLHCKSQKVHKRKLAEQDLSYKY